MTTHTPMKNLYVIIILAGVLSLAPNIKVQSENQTANQDTVTLYANSDFPPYEYLDENGKPSGFDLDIVTTIMKKMGRPYRVVMGRWDEVQKKFKNRDSDILVGVFKHAGLMKIYNYGLTYASLYHGVAYRRGSKPFATLESLKDKKILLEVGDGMEQLLKQRGLSKNIIYVNNMQTGLKMLSENKGDVAVCAVEMAKFTIDQMGLKNLDVSGLELLPEEFSFVCNDVKTLGKMDVILQDMRNSGEFQQISDKWFGNNHYKQQIRYTIISIIILLIIVLIFALFNYLLKRKVNEAKKQLSLDNEMLKQINHKLYAAIDAADIAYLEFDTSDYTFTSYNETLLGDEKVGKYNMKALGEIISAEDLQKLHELDKAFRNGTLKTKTLDLKVWCKKDQEWHYISTTFTQTGTDGEQPEHHYVAFRKDNTRFIKLNNELRDHTAKLNYTLESCGIKFWTYDIVNGMLSIFSNLNNAVEKITIDEFVSRTDKMERERVKAACDKLKTGSKEEFIIQLKLNKYIDQEKTHYILYNGVPELNHDNDVISYYGLARDITDFITVQEKLVKEKEKAQIADKLKLLFLANMSHEIRTPLNAIVGFSQLLQGDYSDDDKQQFMMVINKNTENLLKLINDILELSKLEAGTEKPNNMEFDMAQNFDVITKEMQQRCVNPDVKFIAVNPYKTCKLFSDAGRINQLFTNFILNAIKYTNKGYIKISYKYQGDELTIKVEDTGIGISEEHINVIFERFEKVDNFVQGAGLGLSICKSIVKLLGGHIGVDSKEGQGSTFWASIPCWKINSEEKTSLPES